MVKAQDPSSNTFHVVEWKALYSNAESTSLIVFYVVMIKMLDLTVNVSHIHTVSCIIIMVICHNNCQCHV